MSMMSGLSEKEQAITIYPTAGEIRMAEETGEPSSSVVVRGQMDSNANGGIHQSNRFVRSTVYPEPATNHKSREAVVWGETYRQSFQILSLPMQPATLTILSNVGVLSTLAISMSLPANASIQVTRPRGWGLHLIDRIDFMAGGSTITMNGAQIVQWYVHHAQSQDQLNRLYDLAGTAASGVTWAAGEPTAQVLLPLPWCVPGGWSLDTSLLQANNIQVNVYLNSLTSVLGGTGAASISNSLASGSFYGKTGQFANAARDSVLGELAYFSNVNGDQLTESNIFQQMVPFAVLSQSCSGPAPAAPTSINLSGLDLSRRLKGVVLSFIRTSNRVPGGGNPINPAYFEEVQNLKLVNVGTNLINCFANEEDLFEAVQAGERSQTLSFVEFTGGAGGPYTPTNRSAKIYRLMLTLLDQDTIIESGLPGVQSLQLSFNTTVAATYDIYAAYLYDRNLAFTGSGVEIY